MKFSNSWRIIFFHCFSFSLIGLLNFNANAQLLSSELRLQQDSFISPNFQASNKTSYQILGLRLTNREPQFDSLNIDMRALFAMNAPFMNSLNIPEIYYQNSHDESDSSYLFIGRKRWHWNELDSRWLLGAFEPIYEWNPLNPEAQGLTGLFWQTKGANVHYTIFVSPIYLPSQGPNFEINKNGEFEKGSPWFHSPPDSLRIFKEVSKLEYEFQKPNESSVVSQSSFATALSYEQDEGLQSQISYAYKPMNKLALTYDGILDIPKDRGVVTINPVVVYHSIYGLDLEYKLRNMRVGISGISNRPQNEVKVDEQWTSPTFKPAELATIYMDFDLRYVGFSLQRLQSSGGEVIEKGPLASADRPGITSVYPYREANQASLRVKYRFERNRLLKMQLSYIRSDFHGFDILKWNTSLKLAQSWNIFGEVQLVKADPVGRNNYNEIAALANNDRWMMGAGYAF